MRHSRIIETAVGVFVVAGLAALFMLAMRVSNLSAFSTGDTYHVVAKFENIGSLRGRAPVSMAGVQIGRVSDIRFDEENYQAVVEMAIDARYDKIPADTSASILTAGLLGEQYVGLEAGAATRYVEEGDELRLTQSALVLEQLIGRYMFQGGGQGDGGQGQ